VDIGSRSPGSPGHKEAQRYISRFLKESGIAVKEIPFVAQTPLGPADMKNIIANLKGRSDRIIVLGAHYDTKRETRFKFVGANDGGSGTALLMALAQFLAKRTYKHEIRFVFFDGEEPLEQWSSSDSLYGSRHLAAEWKAEGILPKITAFCLVDMIGDSDLGILRESNSSPRLVDLVWSIAERRGYSQHFLSVNRQVDDDHVPFMKEGVEVINLIDFFYGPKASFWHSPEDTVDKVSSKSLQIVGEVLVDLIEELDHQ
jgi:Zn-dependent M28 family amino/carboxypeptidase